jgi:hypothetical protein
MTLQRICLEVIRFPRTSIIAPMPHTRLILTLNLSEGQAVK